MYHFKLTDKEQETFDEWFQQHHCKIQYGGAIGGSITYSFTPNNIGSTIKVICACGEIKDVTDYDEW